MNIDYKKWKLDSQEMLVDFVSAGKYQTFLNRNKQKKNKTAYLATNNLLNSRSYKRNIV